MSFTNIYKYRDLVYNLVMKDIRVRYMGAFLGFAWSLVNPLVTTLTYVFVFTYLFPSRQEHYPLYLVVGILHWNLFSTVVGQSSEVMVANASLLQKMYFPRYLVPLSAVLVNLVLWLAALAVFFIVYIFIGGKLSLVLLLVPVYLVFLVVFIYGITLILSVLYIEFRDLKHLVDVGLQVLFWVTPIVYTISRVPEVVRQVMEVTPFTEFIMIAHSLFYYGQLPPLHIVFGFVCWTVVTLSVGIWMFKKQVPLLMERL
jgi:homopolymeric O-antigen transport system permease protein